MERPSTLVEKFGEPTAAIISIDELRFLLEAKRRQATASLKELIADVRARNRQLDPDELESLIEAAMAEFYNLRSRRPDPLGLSWTPTY